jgi:glycosyltransferase involved in cell wall biosynthesis
MEKEVKPRIAILLDCPPKKSLREDIAAGKAPRRDYFLLEARLDADLLYPDDASGLGRLIYKCTKLDWQSAWVGFRNRNQYDLIITVSEQIGLPLAALLRLTPPRMKHVLLAHQPAVWKKVLFMYLTGAWRRVDRFVCYGKRQSKLLKQRLLFLKDKQVVVILHPADHHFWKPAGQKDDRLILAAGLEYRDYTTMLEAVDGLDADVYIAASSPWSRRRDETADRSIPENTTVGRLTPDELRRKQQQAAMVVVPLKRVQFQAGSLVMYESMASGNAIIASRTESHDEGEIIEEGKNGLLVEPEAPGALRSAVQKLLTDSKLRDKLGRAARKTVENGLNLDKYIDDLTSLIGDILKHPFPKSEP